MCVRAQIIQVKNVHVGYNFIHLVLKDLSLFTNWSLWWHRPTPPEPQVPRWNRRSKSDGVHSFGAGTRDRGGRPDLQCFGFAPVVMGIGSFCCCCCCCCCFGDGHFPLPCCYIPQDHNTDRCLLGRWRHLSYQYAHSCHLMAGGLSSRHRRRRQRRTLGLCEHWR